MQIKLNRTHGFTLVEIMIVVAIIGLLAAIAIPNFAKARSLSRARAARPTSGLFSMPRLIQQAALEKGLKTGQTAADVVVYLDAGPKPRAVVAEGNTPYSSTFTVGTLPVCPNITAHRRLTSWFLKDETTV